ncbi:hypothetical protein E2491_10375 [Jeotgalibacillus sp. R-1-5s-1]|nr:hypothetical protein E2491_10375 [Jeotgalibacillus sp. R-1-5s-1]
MLAFPTHSPTSSCNTWLFLEHILSFKDTDNPKQIKVIFRNYESLTVDCSYGTIKKQLERATRLFYQDVYQQRKK